MTNLVVSLYVFMQQLKFINKNSGFFFSSVASSTIAYSHLNLLFHQLKIALET